MRILKIILVILLIYLIRLYASVPKEVDYTHDRTTQPKVFIDRSSYIAKGVLDSAFCERLINASRNLKYDTTGEPVDNEPVYQIDILHGQKVVNMELWNICKDVYLQHKDKNTGFDFMFLKRYLPKERVRIPLHCDSCDYTTSFLLSDTKDFEGCEYYMFDKITSMNLVEIANSGVDARDYFIKNHKNLPIHDYQQGDMVKFEGQTHYHGTLPLTKGERYVLTIFYDQKSGG